MGKFNYETTVRLKAAMERREKRMKFYLYSQNNSGGDFDFDQTSGITHYVVVQARNPDDANERAEEIGLYWDGCENDQDCPCCGDRWYPAEEEDAEDFPHVYGKPLDKDWEPMHRWMKGRREAVVHYASGGMEWY